MSRKSTGPVDLVRLRLMLRSQKRRLWRDIQRYAALYSTPHIEAQLADWRKEFARVAGDLAGVERRIARGER